MPAVAEPVRGFALSDFDGPDQPADNLPAGAEAAPPEPMVSPTPELPEAPEREELDTPERPEGEATDQETDGAQTLDEAMTEPDDPAKKAEKERIAADKKASDEAAAAEKAKADAERPADRDADLKYDASPHTHPKTRKIITEFQGKAKAARDAEAAAVARAEAAETRVKEAEEKVKAVGIPKEVEEKIRGYEERIRELDITRDPAIEAKYDKPISTNQATIVDILKSNGYGMAKGEGGKLVENPTKIAELKRNGLTFETLQPLVTVLKEKGLHVDARKIERLIDRNETLSEEKQAQIDAWKKDHGQRIQQREQETQAQRQARDADFRAQTQTQLKNGLEALAKDFSYINQPPAPLATDTPATRAAKTAAMEEYNAAAKKIELAVKGFDPTGVPPEKQGEVVGRLNAAAIEAQVLKLHVLPRVLKDMAAQTARIKGLEAELEKLRGAGRLSRAQTTSPTDGADRNMGRPEPKSLEEAFGSGPSL